MRTMPPRRMSRDDTTGHRIRAVSVDHSKPAPTAVPALEYVVRIGGSVVVVAAALLAAIVGAFLVPFKVSGSYLPVSVVIGVGANIVLPVLAMWWCRLRAVALLPGLVWFVMVLMATQPDTAGSVIVANMWPATVYLLATAATIAVMGYLTIVGTIGRLTGQDVKGISSKS